MKGEAIYWQRKMLVSRAWRSLNGAAKTVLADFMMKRTMTAQKQPGRKTTYVVTNNGQLKYSYWEAARNGFSRPQFQRSIDALIDHGFLDITHQSLGPGDCTLYGLVDRWRDWGTDRFVEKKREKDGRKGRGFSVYWARKREEGSDRGAARV